MDSIQKKETNLKDVLKSDLKSYQVEVDEKLEGILGSLDISVEKDSVDFKRLRNHFIDLYLLRHEWMRELVDQTGKTDDQFRRDAEVKLGMPLFPDVSWTPEDAPKFPTNPEDLSKSTTNEGNRDTSPEVKQVVKLSGQRISRCAELFYDRKFLEDTSPKEIQVLRQNINDFIEVMGDVNVANLTKGEVSEFITIQSKLPSNRKKSPK